MVTADVAIDSLAGAVVAAKPDCTKLTHQSDNGSRYASKKFRRAAYLRDIHPRFIRTHAPEQNGHMERFHGTLKREYVWPHDFPNHQEAEAVISEAFRGYDRSRLHSAPEYVPPDEFNGIMGGRTETKDQCL